METSNMEVEKKDRLDYLFNHVKKYIPNFFLLSGFPRNPFYIPASYRVFSIEYWESEGSDNFFSFMKTIHKEKQYNLLDECDINEFRSDLIKEAPRYIARELLKDSYDNRLTVEAYLGDDDIENLKEFSDPDLVEKSKIVCDHWSKIEEDHPKLIIEKDTEIDELEDFRELANKVREYLNSTLKTKKYEKQFTEPEYIFI